MIARQNMTRLSYRQQMGILFLWVSGFLMAVLVGLMLGMAVGAAARALLSMEPFIRWFIGG